MVSSVGVLFVRSYERGERVHGAMVARGFTGRTPTLDDRRATARDWVAGAVPAAVALCSMILAFGPG